MLGAAGGIGGAVVRELAARGREVRAVGRRALEDLPPGVEELVADVGTPEGARRAVAGAAVVYHCAQPAYTRWPQEFPPLTAAIADATAEAGAKLVFADNLYAYGPHGRALHEGNKERAAGPKGRVRREMAASLLAAHAEERLRVTIGRASDYYGPRGVDSGLGENVFGRAVAGKHVRWLGSLDAPHTMHHLPDIARGLLILGERAEADGRVWHLPAAEPLTGRRLMALIAEASHRPVRVRRTTALELRVAGRFAAMPRELVETMYQWQRPFVSDATAFELAFSPPPSTPHADAVAATVEWFRARAKKT